MRRGRPAAPDGHQPIKASGPVKTILRLFRNTIADGFKKFSTSNARGVESLEVYFTGAHYNFPIELYKTHRISIKYLTKLIHSKDTDPILFNVLN